MSPNDRPTKSSAIQVVGAAILHGDSCLVAQRGPTLDHERLKWEFPGGKIEPGEHPRSALEREIREELGLEIDVEAWLGSGEHSLDGRFVSLDVYTARILSGRIRLTDHCRYGWFRAHEIDRLEWSVADQPILHALETLLRVRSRDHS